METRIPWEIADLIVAKLTDSITSDESERLEQWINASSHHRKLYEEWMDGERYRLFQNVGKEHSYLGKYYEFSNHVAVVKRRRFLKRWSSVAALVAIVTVALVFWIFPRQENTGIAMLNEQIVPGQFKALLTLSNGQTIALAKNTGELEVKNTAAVVRQDTLTYESQDNLNEGQYHRISIPRGGEYILKLSDGTKVWLNSETELRYPAVFSGVQRKVFLKGEAYFEVEHDSLHPFIVETGPQRLTVLGTSFAIRAYEDEKSITTTLESGRVNIEVPDRQIVLSPGYQTRLNAEGLKMEKVNTSLYTAWRKGVFIFANQRLGDILNTLSRWYNIEVFYTSAELETISFTGELKRYGDIREFLEKIQLLEKVRFEIKGRTVTVSKY